MHFLASKLHCISNLKQHLANVWQSAAERYWRGNQQMEKVTSGQRACTQIDNILNTFYELLMSAKQIMNK